MLPPRRTDARRSAPGRPPRLALVLVLVTVAGCPDRQATRLTDTVVVPSVVEVRDIRVLIASGTEPLRFRVNGPYTIRDARGGVVGGGRSRRWTAVTASSRLTVGGQIVAGPTVDVLPQRRSTFEFSRKVGGKWSPARRYAGRLTFRLRPDGRILAINRLDVDTYLAGVLTRELYPDFHREAYRAQAVAARTYALHQMSQRVGSDYDVTATEASQVYGGLAVGRSARRAVEAVQYTRGVVCTWSSPRGERVFCTYYSSACGGMSQDVADCKPRPSIPPLAGGVKCDYCRIAKGNVYRWGPVSISKREIGARLAARHPRWADLGDLRRVQVASRTRFGRLGTIRVIGSSGRSHELRAEDFRLVVGSRTMRSTDCRLSDDGDRITLSRGRGFGHGMGLCQWGVQGQALAGRKAADILKFYYPSAHLTRAY